jgi:hypothetical protein
VAWAFTLEGGAVVAVEMIADPVHLARLDFETPP